MNQDPLGILEEAHRLDRAGQHTAALLAYRRFLALRNDHALAWADYGGLLLEMKRHEDAREACQKALALDATCLSALINLASALENLGETERSMALFRRVLEADSSRTDARLGLGHCLATVGDLAGARAVLKEALHLQPNHPQVRLLLIQVLARQGNWTEARNLWDQSIDATFMGDEARFERSHLRLLFGELTEGWALHESRLAVPGLVKPDRHFTQPRWDGSPFPGKTLLLHWEQGFGDTLMFVRYASRVKALGGQVLLEAQAPLADLVSTCPGVDRVIPFGEPLPPFDLQLPLLSLPLIFRTGIHSIPGEIPYLQVPDQVPHRQAINRLLETNAQGPKIGLVWSGNVHHVRDTQRSIPIEFLAPLSELQHVTWFSLQLEAFGELPLPGMVDLAAQFSNFSDTAFAVRGLDLVITVDTAVAHVAGALGVPTLLLVPFFPDWRWLLDREDSPWYPSTRIYRQPTPGDWPSVIAKLVGDLR